MKIGDVVLIPTGGRNSKSNVLIDGEIIQITDEIRVRFDPKENPGIGIEDNVLGWSGFFKESEVIVVPNPFE
jgi:hypothetical protein